MGQPYTSRQVGYARGLRSLTRATRQDARRVARALAFDRQRTDDRAYWLGVARRKWAS